MKRSNWRGRECITPAPNPPSFRCRHYGDSAVAESVVLTRRAATVNAFGPIEGHGGRPAPIRVGCGAMSNAERVEKETGPVEAFSDGRVAIAITLLILAIELTHTAV